LQVFGKKVRGTVHNKPDQPYSPPCPALRLVGDLLLVDNTSKPIQVGEIYALQKRPIIIL